ncbi:MAG: hypothetical protein HBSIN02_22580 [Bacteroidia bacterium]|nr:MAG: hypothetical protein HBSIN02_22580 [Bacteroidia bacterium]
MFAIAIGKQKRASESFQPGEHPGRNSDNIGKGSRMRRHYDFSKAQKNPYAGKLKRSVTIRIDQRTIDYFKNLSVSTGIAYQTLINLYLRECAASGRKLSLQWK